MERRRRYSSRSIGHRAWTRYLLWAGVAGLTLLIFLLAFRRFSLQPTNSSPPVSAGRTAAIVDQVALTVPNPQFTEQALAYLITAGFDVDVYEGEDITVEFFRTLPTRGYDLILFRTHSTNDFLDVTLPGDPVYLYTGERHDRNRYTYLQLTRQIMAGRVLYEEDAPALFIIGPKFVRQSMKGRFEDTLLIIGGCDSLSTTDLADAFLERGASAVVGWNGLVDLTHNDQALLYLLRMLAVEGLSVEQAVARTRVDIGPDPALGSLPNYYPPERGDQRIGFTDANPSNNDPFDPVSGL